MRLDEYPVGERFPDEMPVVVEIPTGCRNKYEFDHATGCFRLDRVLSSPLHYPTEYGFVPQTLAGDGDPLDVLVPMAEPSFSGCVIGARPIGILKMKDEKGEDFKVLAVPVSDRRYSDVLRLADVPSHLLLEIEHFFTVYKELDGLYPSVAGWEDERAAREYVMICHQTYIRVS